MNQYKKHIFVCLGKRCAGKGSEEILEAFKAGVKEKGLSKDVKVSKSGCMKVCKETDTEGEYSPTAVVYPEGVWYRNLTLNDVAEIIEAHLKGGSPVERLVHFKLRP